LIRLLGEYPAFKADPYGLGNIEYSTAIARNRLLFIDYRHGYRQETRCPKCVDEKYFRDEILPKEFSNFI